MACDYEFEEPSNSVSDFAFDGQEASFSIATVPESFKVKIGTVDCDVTMIDGTTVTCSLGDRKPVTGKASLAVTDEKGLIPLTDGNEP